MNENLVYGILQKIIGTILLSLGILVVKSDTTISVVLLVIGCPLIISKKKILF